MANNKQSAKNMPAPSPEFGMLAAFLSYLIPGLGQIIQGRVSKGLLFFFSIYALFFYGMFLGSGAATINAKHYQVTGNVYLPDTATKNPVKVLDYTLWTPVGNVYNRPQFLGQFWIGVAAWPAIYHYCIPPANPAANDDKDKADTMWSRAASFEETPSEEALNAVHTAGDKLIELGWVYTVIAGVLNIMVIYDAFAGPAFPPKKQEPEASKGLV
jgi:TM2 domain-containing membrane protein YozV